MSNQKQSLWVVVFLLFSVHLNAQDSPLSLNLKMKKPALSYKANTKLILVGELCNKSSSTVEISEPISPQDYFIKLTVTQENGTPVKFIGPQQRLPLKKVNLKPAECRQMNYDLNKLFNISIGNYFIQGIYFSDMFSWSKSEHLSQSNILGISVVGDVVK